MLLYNVTTKIHKDAEANWLHWMKHKHIPDVLDTGQFLDAHICKLLDQAEGEDSTYVIQYQCENREKFDEYVNRFAPALRNEHNAKYKDKFVSFRTLMEIV